MNGDSKPKGPKRSADVVGATLMVGQIATGKTEENTVVGDDGKDKAAQSMGRKGGKARSEKLTPEGRSEITRKAAAKRWQK